MAYEASLGLIALTRFGFGPRGDGDVAIATSDPHGFLAAELAEPGIALLSSPTLPSTKTAIQQFFQDAEMRKMERAQQAAKAGPELPTAPAPAPGMTNSVAAMAPTTPLAKTETMSQTMAGAEPAKPPPKPPTPEQIIFRDEALARFRRAIEARAGFAERLVTFWSNHFCVSANKGGIARATCGAFEREAIRPHVLGKFSDMLIAVETHPAMLHFLDNAQSVGPNSKAGQRGKRGLNENLGREIMELHTMGAGAGYTQADVTNLARILTGWTYVGRKAVQGEPGTFLFNPNTHEPGPIPLLGKTYPEDGLDQGRAALQDIARRPETARFIATKFARAFVADVPPPTLVDFLANRFRETDGNLRALALALIESPESWGRAPARMRTPYELIVGTHRLLARLPEEPGVVLGPLREMGMPLWTPPGPNGFSTDMAAWATPEGMKLRLDYCALVGARLKDPPNPSDLLDALCGTPSAETKQAIARAESRQQGLALLLMSPEMQRS